MNTMGRSCEYTDIFHAHVIFVETCELVIPPSSHTRTNCEVILALVSGALAADNFIVSQRRLHPLLYFQSTSGLNVFSGLIFFRPYYRSYRPTLQRRTEFTV